MNQARIKDALEWYSKNWHYYESFAAYLKENTLFGYIANRPNIAEVYQVSIRHKARDSFFDKIISRNYDNDYDFTNMPDIVGARIVGYTKSDVNKLIEVVRKEFVIHEIDDKHMGLGQKETGYQSVHIIASLKHPNYQDKDYEKYKDIKFEIQVRTVLQESWAALNHKKNYKFKGYLPQETKRALYLFSGTLELLDDQLERISNEVLNSVKSLKDKFCILERERPEIAEFLYASKIIHDLRLSDTTSLYDVSVVQKLVFGTVYEIAEKYSIDAPKLQDWIDKESLRPYEISIREIDFSEAVKKKLLEFVNSQLKVCIVQDSKESQNLIVKSFHTIWKGVHGDFDLSYPIGARFAINRNELLRLESRSEFILQIGITDAYLSHEERRYSIHAGGNKLDCKEVPPGEYDLIIKTEYEPSNDGMANFIDRVKVD